MAVLKCKMCGGDLSIENNERVCVCTFCGTQQTVPSLDNDKKIKLFERANRLRTLSEFDKAYGVYESIVEEYTEEAEAYWGLVLCKYGIEYVDDINGSKVPTCHRSSFESVLDDPNYEMALEYADVVARGVYREEAKAIERLRRDIIEVSQKQAPYDIFICYKETAEGGGRTIDSVIAQDVYDALKDKGYKVFFSRISLEDKLGVEYEPFIFSALHSAKIMLAFGTKYDYYNAVWVKNEWSRFLKLIAQGEKKTLIPCFKDIDIDDMPPEFRRLQAQDMGKVGAIQDLLHGIEKIIGTKKQQGSTQSSNGGGASPSVDNFLKRISDFLDEKDWDSVNTYCEKVLDVDFSNAYAYLGKYLAEHRASSLEELSELKTINTNSTNYRSIQKYGDEALKKDVNEAVNNNAYKKAYNLFERGDLEASMNAFKPLFGFKNSEEMYNLAKNKISESIYNQALEQYKMKNYEKAAGIFEQVLDYKDAKELYEKSLKENIEFLYELGNKLLESKRYQDAADKFRLAGDYKDSKELYNKASELFKEDERKKAIYNQAGEDERNCTYNGFMSAYELYKQIPDFYDSDERRSYCLENAKKCLQNEKMHWKAQIENKNNKKHMGIGTLILVTIVLCCCLLIPLAVMLIKEYINKNGNLETGSTSAQDKQYIKSITARIAETEKKLEALKLIEINEGQKQE